MPAGEYRLKVQYQDCTVKQRQIYVYVSEYWCLGLTPQYRSSLKICGGRGFPVVGLDSSGTFSRIHFLFSSLLAISHSSNWILLTSKKPMTSCCCFLICEIQWGGGGQMVATSHLLYRFNAESAVCTCPMTDWLSKTLLQLLSRPPNSISSDTNLKCSEVKVCN